MKNLPKKKRVVNIISIKDRTILMDIDSDYIVFINVLGTVFKLNGDTVLLKVSTLREMGDVVDYIRSFND